VAANLAICALGSETAGSVRNPANYNNIVGIVGTQGLPEFLGRPFAESKLFEIASAYERFTRHRRPPSGFGGLPGER